MLIVIIYFYSCLAHVRMRTLWNIPLSSPHYYCISEQEEVKSVSVFLLAPCAQQLCEEEEEEEEGGGGGGGRGEDNHLASFL